MSENGLQPEEADWLRANGSQICAELYNARSEVTNLRGATVALRRDASKVKKQLTEMLSRVRNLTGISRDCEVMLKETNLTCNELSAEVKMLNRMLGGEKERGMEERNRNTAEKMGVRVEAIENA